MRRHAQRSWCSVMHAYDWNAETQECRFFFTLLKALQTRLPIQAWNAEDKAGHKTALPAMSDRMAFSRILHDISKHAFDNERFFDVMNMAVDFDDDSDARVMLCRDAHDVQTRSRLGTISSVFASVLLSTLLLLTI